MSRGAFAKLPSAWVRQPKISGEAGDGKVPYIDELGNQVFVDGGLIMLQWSQHKGGATAALLILFALAVISNKAQRKDGLRKDETVAATYPEIHAMVPLSRKLISDGLELLVMVKAITKVRDGRRNLFTLNGIDQNGHWCALPQSHLHDRQAHLRRLGHFVDQLRRPMSLHALKLYMLILHFRDRHTNFASIGYDKIQGYTGLRRNDINTAKNLLISMELLRLVRDEEHARRPSDPHHNRYAVCGLDVS